MTNMDGKGHGERRFLPRAALLAPALVVDTSGWSQHALVEDLSPTGMGLVANIPFTLQQSIQVVLQLPGMPPQYLQGVVVQAVALGQQRYRYGVLLQQSLSADLQQTITQPAQSLAVGQFVAPSSGPKDTMLLISGYESAASRSMMEMVATAGLAAVAVNNSLDAIEWLLVKEAKIRIVCLEPLLPEEEQYEILAFLGSEYPAIKRMMLHGDYQVSGRIGQHIDVQIPANMLQEQLVSILHKA